MKTFWLALLVIVYWLLHQDYWNWSTGRPLTFGFLPPGLTYHALYTIGIAGLMAVLVKFAWPFELEREVDGSGD